MCTDAQVKVDAACFSFICPFGKVTTQSAEGPARAVTHLAVVGLLNCSLIGPLQRLITPIPTARPQKVSGCSMDANIG